MSHQYNKNNTLFMRTKQRICISILSIVLFFLTSNAYGAVRTFDNSSGDNKWSTATNWSTDVLPAVGDDVTIPSGFTCNLDVSIPVGGLNSLSVAGTLNLATFNMIVVGATTISTTGTIADNSTTGTNTFADVTVDGTWNITANQAFTISGSLTVNTGATFTSASGTYTFSSTVAKVIGGTLTPLTLSGNVVISGAGQKSIAGTLNIGGTLTINSGSDFYVKEMLD